MWEISVLPKLYCKSKSVAKFKKKDYKKRMDIIIHFAFHIYSNNSNIITRLLYILMKIWLNQFSSVAQPCPTLCDPIDYSTPGFPVHHQLPEPTQTHVHLINHLILCSVFLPPSVFPSIRVFFNESVLHIRWPTYWSFSFSSSPSKEYSRLISFRMDWLDLLAVQGTLKSLLQHHNSKVSILRASAFFVVQFHIHTWQLEKP